MNKRKNEQRNVDIITLALSLLSYFNPLSGIDDPYKCILRTLGNLTFPLLWGPFFLHVLRWYTLTTYGLILMDFLFHSPSFNSCHCHPGIALGTQLSLSFRGRRGTSSEPCALQPSVQGPLLGIDALYDGVHLLPQLSFTMSFWFQTPSSNHYSLNTHGWVHSELHISVCCYYNVIIRNHINFLS